MAKKTTNAVPTIRENHVLASWLNKESQLAGSSTAVETDQKAVSTAITGEPTDREAGVGVASEPVQADTQLPVAEAIGGERGGIINAVSDAPTVDSSPQVPPLATSPGTGTGRGKNKLEGSLSSRPYPETFFKKPIKSEPSDSVSEYRPIRISEDSHWLLSVLVESARRLGNKLTVADLIENLLTDHREVYKEKVDELINQWKARKKIG